MTALLLAMPVVAGMGGAPALTVSDLSFDRPAANCSDGTTMPDASCFDLEWDLPWCPGERLRSIWARRYPVTLELSDPAPERLFVLVDVRASYRGGGDVTIGTLHATWARGETVAAIRYPANQGANRNPDGVIDIDDAFWLGCTNEGEIRGNAGPSSSYFRADVYLTIVSQPPGYGLDGETTSPNPARPIHCHPRPQLPECP